MSGTTTRSPAARLVFQGACERHRHQPAFDGMEEDGIEANFPAEFRTRETADLFLVLYEKLLAPIAETRAKLKAQLMEALTR